MAKSKTKKNDFEKFIKLGPKHKLSVSIFKNQDDKVVLNLRKFYLHDEDNDEWRPDRQGLTMHLEQAKKLRIITKELEEIQDDAPEADFGKKDFKKSNKKSKKSKDDDDEDD